MTADSKVDDRRFERRILCRRPLPDRSDRLAKEKLPMTADEYLLANRHHDASARSARSPSSTTP